MKDKVIERLVKWGNNPTEVQEWVNEHFDYAARSYSTVNRIAECISIIR